MKKVMLLVVVLVSSLVLTACKEADLKILMPGEYIAEDIVPMFQKKYKVRVKIVPFESNEAAITKLKTEKFDLMIPSDYGAEQLIAEDLIYPMDWSKIDAIDKDVDFPDVLNDLFTMYAEDETPLALLDYMVPYFWGNIGIVYNKEKINKAQLEAAQWNIFSNSSIKKVMYDSSRDGFMVALKHLGYSANTTNQNQLVEAETYLKTVSKTKDIVFLTDEVLDDMRIPKYDIALVYSGDAIYLMSEQSKLDYFVPTVGTNVFIDGFVIPKTSRNIELAYTFINYVSTYEIAKLNTEEIMYQTPRKDVYNYILSSESALYEFKDAYDVKINPNDELFRYIPQVKSFMDDAWANIRSS